MSEYKATTPIDTFKQPEGSQIDLVSVVHIGSSGYYSELGRYLKARHDEGFTVHYEEIAEGDDIVEPSGPLEAVKWRLNEVHIDEGADFLAHVEGCSDYTFQDYPKLLHGISSERHDITEAESVRQTSLLTSVVGLFGAQRLRRRVEREANKGTEAINEFVFGLIKQAVVKERSSRRRKKHGAKVIIHARNQIALEAVDSVLEDDLEAKLVLIWGLGHLAGLQSGLVDRGYVHTDRQEIVAAFNLPQLRRSIQQDRADLQRLERKLGQRQDSTATYTAGRSLRAKDFGKNSRRREDESKKMLEESRKRSERIIQQLEQDRRERQRRGFGITPVDKCHRNRRQSS